MSYNENQSIDVICQHRRDGSIVPIKIKLQDEDGEYQIFRISAYRPLVEAGSHMMPNGVTLGNHIWTYECKINVFGVEKITYLIYNTTDGIWKCRTMKER